MSLQELSWKSVYRSGDQDLLTEFYAPMLSKAVSYDRAVGYFSSEALIMNLQGVASLIQNGGQMRLIIGHPLDESEFQAVKRGHELSRVQGDLRKMLDDVIEASKSKPVNRLELLAWLIASDRLEIKFALRKKGMYHEKIGVVKDEQGNTIVFQGSANETFYALNEGFNAESLMVFSSWNEPTFSEYGKPCIEGFDDLWGGTQRNTVTLPVPSEFYERIAAACTPSHRPDGVFEKAAQLAYEAFFSESSSYGEPQVPSNLGGKSFNLFDHQKNAIRLWAANHYKGIFKLATGSGKTITAIYAATRLFEARKKAGGNLVVVVSVPYQELAKQWVESFNLFNVKPIMCWDSRHKWFSCLERDVLALNMRAIDFIGIVVVNRTMEGSTFRGLIQQLDDQAVMLIGDECHNHGALKTNTALPDVYYRLGLSATPFRSDEDEVESPFPDAAKERIKQYYGDVVSEYGLGDAIHDGVLCEYDYHIIPVHLTQLEQEKYEALSGEIGKLIIIQRSQGLSVGLRASLTMLCGQRSRLLGGAQNKLAALGDAVSGIHENARKHTLFYCGEGNPDPELLDFGVEDERTINSVSRVLHENGWKTARFTSVEPPAQRKLIMENFVSGDIDALVSMKVLDEGIDVPVCEKAFILASTRNPRQYVQRRGRVLRKAEGKIKAEIYDFVTLPAIGSSSSSSQRLKTAELQRIDDFCLLAINKLDIENEIDQLGLRDE